MPRGGTDVQLPIADAVIDATLNVHNGRSWILHRAMERIGQALYAHASGIACSVTAFERPAMPPMHGDGFHHEHRPQHG